MPSRRARDGVSAETYSAANRVLTEGLCGDIIIARGNRMKRVILIAIVALIAAITLSGCSPSSGESQEEKALKAKDRREHEELRKSKSPEKK